MKWFGDGLLPKFLIGFSKEIRRIRKWQYHLDEQAKQEKENVALIINLKANTSY